MDDIQQDLLEVTQELKAFIEKHLQGKHNQKTHGNKYGGGYSATKESLRRLKDDKGAREKYKAKAREKANSINNPKTVDLYGKKYTIAAGDNGVLTTNNLLDGTYNTRKRRSIQLSVIDRQGKDTYGTIDFDETFRGTNIYQIGRNNLIEGVNIPDSFNKSEIGKIRQTLVNIAQKTGTVTKEDFTKAVTDTIHSDYVGKKNSITATIPVKVAGKLETATFPAIDNNGLLLHRSLDNPNHVSITHKDSGLLIGETKSIKKAQEVSKRLNDAGNWNIPADKVDRDLKIKVNELKDSGDLL